MSLCSKKLMRLSAGLLVALWTTGCQAPWTTAPSFTRVGVADHPAAKHDGAISATGNSPGDNLVANSHAPNPVATNAGESDKALADVMQEVERAGATDPAAQKMLLDELQQSRPELWPLIVQQFRSSASYHQQLAAKQSVAVGAKNDDSDRTAQVFANNPQAALAPAARPSSARVGELVDPRGVRSDTGLDQTGAVATPANMPAPLDAGALALAASAPKMPQPLATNQAALPIASANLAAPNAAPAPHLASSTMQVGDGQHQAKQAIYEAPADGSSSVKQALATASISKPQDGSGTTNDSTTDPGSHDWRRDVDQAIMDLKLRLPDAPQTTAEVHQQVSLRLLELLAGRTEDALKPIPQISHEEQDYWSSQIYALATYLDHHSQPDDKRRAAASVAHLEEAVGHLRELGSLSLRNLTFCKHVYDFGAYEPYDDVQFAPGQQLTLYVEVENYHSDSTDKGYCTSLGTSYEIFDDQGKRIDGGDFPDVEDCCRSRRRDFHIQYGMSMPKKLSPGKYRLDLVMKDRRGDKLGHASIDFEIRGGKS
jgi:hypothetical protein